MSLGNCALSLACLGAMEGELSTMNTRSSARLGTTVMRKLFALASLWAASTAATSTASGGRSGGASSLGTWTASGESAAASGWLLAGTSGVEATSIFASGSPGPASPVSTGGGMAGLSGATSGVTGVSPVVSRAPPGVSVAVTPSALSTLSAVRSVDAGVSVLVPARSALPSRASVEASCFDELVVLLHPASTSAQIAAVPIPWRIDLFMGKAPKQGWQSSTQPSIAQSTGAANAEAEAVASCGNLRGTRHTRTAGPKSSRS